MLTLRNSPASPFGRKVVIAADLCAIPLKIEPADTNNPADTLRGQNPLGKIPTLVTDSGETYFDSRVIIEYFDQLAGGKLLGVGAERLRVLRLQALCDGVLDAALLRVYEARLRPEEQRSAAWLDSQTGKVDRGLAYLEANLPAAGDHRAGAIALACVLGYLDLRFAGAWRAGHPNLVAWLDGFAAAVPAFGRTKAA